MVTINFLSAAVAVLAASPALAARQDPVAVVGQVTANALSLFGEAEAEILDAPAAANNVSDLLSRSAQPLCIAECYPAL